MRSLRVGHDWATSLSLFTVMHWRRKWQPTPVFLPGESQGRGSLVGCHLMGSHRVGHDWSDLAAATTLTVGPGASEGKESSCNTGNLRLDPWVRKVPWRRKWQLTPVFLPAEFHGVWWATVHRMAKSQAQLKWLSTHLSSELLFL